MSTKTLSEAAEEFQKDYFQSAHRTYDDIRNTFLAGATYAAEIKEDEIRELKEQIKTMNDNCISLNLHESRTRHMEEENQALRKALEWITDYGDIQDAHARKVTEILKRYPYKGEAK